MAPRPRAKTYYKVTFSYQNEVYQVCARNVTSSDLYGLIEIGDFIFPSSSVIFQPGEERLRKEFEGIRRTLVPYHAVLRIDEVEESREREIRIVPLEAARKLAELPAASKQDA